LRCLRMYWMYRVIEVRDGDVRRFIVGEVYFTDGGQPKGWLDALYSDTLSQLRSDFKMMQEAFDHPPLVFDIKNDKWVIKRRNRRRTSRES
jgi:hypothetical protein